MTAEWINEKIKEAHKNAVEKGFYPEGEDKNIGELLMLIVSELGEALEAHRKGMVIVPDIDDILENIISSNPLLFKAGMKQMEEYKDYMPFEIADVFIRLFDLCGYLDIDIEKHINAKMAYNKTRPKKHGKEY